MAESQFKPHACSDNIYHWQHISFINIWRVGFKLPSESLYYYFLNHSISGTVMGGWAPNDRGWGAVSKCPLHGADVFSAMLSLQCATSALHWPWFKPAMSTPTMAQVSFSQIFRPALNRGIHNNLSSVCGNFQLTCTPPAGTRAPVAGRSGFTTNTKWPKCLWTPSLI